MFGHPLDAPVLEITGRIERMAYTIQAAVNEVKQKVRQESYGPGEATAKLWSEIRKKLCMADKDLLAQEGLLDRVGGAMHIDRFPSQGQAVHVEMEPGHPQVESHVSVLVAVRYVVGTGEMKALVDFTQSDCLFIAQRCRERSSGFIRVATFMDNLRELLITHKAARVSELPVEARRELEGKWPSKGVQLTESPPSDIQGP